MPGREEKRATVLNAFIKPRGRTLHRTINLLTCLHNICITMRLHQASYTTPVPGFACVRARLLLARACCTPQRSLDSLTRARHSYTRVRGSCVLRSQCEKKDRKGEQRERKRGSKRRKLNKREKERAKQTGRSKKVMYKYETTHRDAEPDTLFHQIRDNFRF